MVMVSSAFILMSLLLEVGGWNSTPAKSDEGRVGQTGRTEFDNDLGA